MYECIHVVYYDYFLSIIFRKNLDFDKIRLYCKNYIVCYI